MADEEIIPINDVKTSESHQKWNPSQIDYLFFRIKNNPHVWMWSEYFHRNPQSISHLIKKICVILKMTTKEVVAQIEYLGRKVIQEIEAQSQEGENYSKWQYYEKSLFILKDWKQVCEVRKKFVKILAEYPEVWRCPDSVSQYEEWKTIVRRMQKIFDDIPYFRGKVIDSKMLCSLWNNTYLGAVMNEKLIMQPNPFGIRSFPRMFHYCSEYIARRPVGDDFVYFILNDKKQLKYSKVKYPNTKLLRNKWPPEAFYSTEFCSYNNFDVLDDFFRPDSELNAENESLDEMLLFSFVLKARGKIRDQSFYKTPALWEAIQFKFLELGLKKSQKELKTKWRSIINCIKNKLIMAKTYPDVPEHVLNKYETEVYFYFSDAIDLVSVPSAPGWKTDKIKAKGVPSEKFVGSDAKPRTGTIINDVPKFPSESQGNKVNTSPEWREITIDKMECSENDDCSILEEKIEKDDPGSDPEMEETSGDKNLDFHEEINYIKSLLMETS